jgi:hypothetical protein
VNGLEGTNYPSHFFDFLKFLCKKYALDESRIFIEYSSSQPPRIEGGRTGYYDGLLSYRENNGHQEFLITVFNISRDPLLTLAHEFAHLVKNLKSGIFDKHLDPPDDRVERLLDAQAQKDLAEYRSTTQA